VEGGDCPAVAQPRPEAGCRARAPSVDVCLGASSDLGRRRRLDLELFYSEIGQPVDLAVSSACTICQVRRTYLREAMIREDKPLMERIRQSGIWSGRLPCRQPP
jgi:hypothetical protein